MSKPSDDATKLVQLLEAFYQLEQPRAAWLRTVVKAASAAFERGAGVAMVLYDVSNGLPQIEEMDGVNIGTREVELSAALHRHVTLSRRIADCYCSEVCSTFAEHVSNPELRNDMRRRSRATGIVDQVLINGANPSGHGAALYVMSKTPIALLDAERELMARVAVHLSAAYRLVRRLEPSRGVNDGGSVEAVLTVDGRLEHAEPVASANIDRLGLSAAVKRRELSRRNGRRTGGAGPTQTWRPLVSGRWTLVDSYERNGLRYVTARENTPASRGLPALSVRERQVASLAALGHSNKLVAYELGLAHSTVRVLLARAAAKLGARTRSEVIQQVRAQQ